MQPQGSNHSLEAQFTASMLKSQPKGSIHSVKAQFTVLMLKFKTRASKLTKHRSSAPSGPLPLSPHTHIYSHRGNGYRWPSNASATIRKCEKIVKKYEPTWSAWLSVSELRTQLIWVNLRVMELGAAESVFMGRNSGKNLAKEIVEKTFKSHGKLLIVQTWTKFAFLKTWPHREMNLEGGHVLRFMYFSFSMQKKGFSVTRLQVKQARIHGQYLSNSITTDQPTDGPTNQWTKPLIELRVRN